jgi:hypothetical protein
MAMLYELSRRTQQLDLHQPPGYQLLHLVRELFAVDAIAIFDSVNAYVGYRFCEAN